MNLLGLLSLTLLTLSGGALAAVEGSDADDLRAPILSGLGDNHVAITTNNPTAQMLFDQGLSLHYAFNHPEAIRSFNEAARLDSKCASCYAGAALALGPNLNAAMDPADLPKAQALVQKAQARAPFTTAIEQQMIHAIAQRYMGGPEVERSDLDQAYADAMKKVYQAYPNDPDVASLYAESLMVMHPWDFWTSDYKAKPWTAEILSVLEKGLEAHPNHIFLNHLYIHAVEASSQPEKAMPSADRLGKLAPGAGHLVHMPAHIYIRTGNYHKGSEANLKAIAADEAYLQQVEAQGVYVLGYVPHNHHFLWATATMEGASELAMKAAKGTAERVDRSLLDQPGLETLQHFSVIPLYAMVSFGHWDDILQTPMPEGERLYPMTIWHYAQGMALVNKGQLEAAAEHLAFVRQASKDERLKKITIWGINTTQDLAKIATEILAGDLAMAHDQPKAALAHYRQAVQLEDQLNYDEPSSWATPTRWYLGDALLKTEQFEQAEQVYRKNLERLPKLGWALKGLELALLGQGKDKEAAEVRVQFDQAWQHADIVLKSSRM